MIFFTAETRRRREIYEKTVKRLFAFVRKTPRLRVSAVQVPRADFNYS